MQSTSCFQNFKTNISTYELPEKFTFPFYYDPHPIAIIATNELKTHLLNQNVWIHNFGLNNDNKGTGKMFGVLVVKKSNNQIGYIAAYSGVLAGKNKWPVFVPPIFDITDPKGFYIKGQKEINNLNDQIKLLESNNELLKLKNIISNLTKNAIDNENNYREKIIINRQIRNEKRKEAKDNLKLIDIEKLNNSLKLESIKEKNQLKILKKSWQEKVIFFESKLNKHLNEIKKIKDQRKCLSIKLQEKIFNHYSFLNVTGDRKNLRELFKDSLRERPPSAAGECAAPKLLQYAFLNMLKPIAMAEFWWGKSPDSKIRKHEYFYPACQGKCKPILIHMLSGINIDNNPLNQNLASKKKITIIHEDQSIIVINKPPELLSVPGITVKDSVYNRIKIQYPEITGPIIIHRLDMSTSGIMILAKNKMSHKYLQKQFIERTIKKTYIAILDGVIEKEKGEINLPIRLDINDRPRQLVCNKFGKKSVTLWKVINIKDGKTKISFDPITGRTHQLRVHSAHKLGLNTPILGDDLYGIKSDRLYLHAKSIEIDHPEKKERLKFMVKENF